MKKILLLISVLFFVDLSYSQVNVKVTLLYNRVQNNRDFDGFLSGDSDFCFEYLMSDNTAGNEVNQGPTKPTTNTGYTFRNGDNGPWTVTHNRLVFDHNYECPSQVPTQMNITWRGLENDDATNYTLLLNDANTGDQNVALALGGGAVGTYTQTYTASASGQVYEINFEAVVTAINVDFLEDDICDATQHNIGQTKDYSWCGMAGFEPNEKWKTDEEISGSGWIMFRTPNSGTVNISTDFSQTDFGTEYYVYHAADGFNCGNGNAVNGTQVKTKFDYLSFVDYADDDIPVFSPEGKADQNFSNNVFDAGKPLVPNEVYYIQIGTDETNRYGNIRVSISDLNRTGAEVQDIPCQAPLRTYGTTEVSDDNGDSPTFSLSKARCYDLESDEGDNAVSLAAYPIDEALSGGNDVNGTAWFKFVAPCSGRMSIETNLNASGEAFYLFKADERFGPGIPSDYKCKDLVIPNNDYATYYVDGGIGSTAKRVFDCLEPGYEYYVSLDPDAVNISNTFDVWLFDPGTALGQPGNDILCQALADNNYEIPVESINGPTFGATPGNYAGACFEELAGEPYSSNNPSTRANKTVWHYFYAPPSGSIDIIVSASNPVNWSIYNSFDGTLNGCYGGLANNSNNPCPPSNLSANNGRTYTIDGTQNTAQISPLVSSISGSGAVELCCLNPGDLYVIQVDGRDAFNTNALYTIEINENEVFAGNTIVETNNGTSYNAASTSPAIVCFGDYIDLSRINQNVPSCKGIGYILHDSSDPTPSPIITDSIELNSVNVYSSTYNQLDRFVNDGTSTAPSNTLIYASALADRMSTWGDICPSADVEDAVGVVFLEELQVTNVSVDGINCVPLQNNVFVSVDGGMPAYDNSNYTWEVMFNGVVLFSGAQTYGSTIDFFAPVQGIYQLTLTDDFGCTKTLSVDATGVLCNDFCLLFNPISVQPSYPDFYECNPITYGATFNIVLDGGAPEFFPTEVYTVNQTINGVLTAYTSLDSVNFNLNNGDVWSLEVWDNYNCDTLSLTDTFNFDNMDCAHICDENPLSTNNQPYGFSYNCLSNNITEISIVASGGLPSLNNTSYFITVSGSTYPNQNVANTVFNNSIEHHFYANAGDNWRVEIYDSLGCGPVIVEQALPAIFEFSNFTDSVSCDGDTLYGVLNGSEIGVDYRLLRNGVPTTINVAGTGAPIVFGPIVTNGEYSVQSYASYTCPQDMDNRVEFLFSSNLDVALALVTDVSCFGNNDGAVDVSTTGGAPAYNYTWTDASNTVIANTEDLNNVAAGIYSVLVTDNYGCQDSLTAIAVQGPTAALSATINTVDVLCFGSNSGEASVTATGGTAPYSYLWHTNDTAQTIIGLESGNVSVTITDANGCSVYVSDVLTGPSAALEITSNRQTNVTCYGGNNGALLTAVSGGTAPYSITWSHSLDTTSSIDSLFAGVYTINVEDANGCLASATFTITEPDSFAISIAPTQPDCAGEQTGIAAVGVNGGTAPYSYEWNTTPPQFGIVATQLFGDRWYNVTVTDAKGCEKIDSVFIQNPDTMTVSVEPGNTNCINGTNGQASIVVDGGSAPFSYELNGNYQVDSFFIGLTPGNYFINVEDNKGCQANSQFTINPSTSVQAELYASSASTVNATDEVIIVSGEEVNFEVELTNTTDSTEIIEYIWTPLGEFNFSNCTIDTLCDMPSANFISTTDVVVEVIELVNGAGCSTFDTISIVVRTDYPAFFPTAFSPFSDDFKTDCLNDYFEMNVAGASNLDVKVFNRWGELVFANPNQTNGPADPNNLDCTNPRNAWDGTFEGKPVPIGAYVYQVVATYFNGKEETFTGTITVLR